MYGFVKHTFKTSTLSKLNHMRIILEFQKVRAETIRTSKSVTTKSAILELIPKISLFHIRNYCKKNLNHFRRTN